LNNKTYNWRYNWLISCPHVVLINAEKWRHHDIYIGIPLLNSRTIIMEDGEKTTLLNTPYTPSGYTFLHMDHCVESFLTPPSTENLYNMMRASNPVMLTAYYGGYNVFIDSENPEIIVSEIVADNIFVHLYKKPLSLFKMINTELDNLVILGVALRKGNLREYWGVEAIGIRDRLSGEILVFSEKPLPGKQFFKIDNTGFRQVVKANFIGCKTQE